MRTHARYDLQDSASSLEEVLPSSSLDSPLSIGSGGLITASSRSVSSESAEPIASQTHQTSSAVDSRQVNIDEEVRSKPPSPMDTNEVIETGEQKGSALS